MNHYDYLIVGAGLFGAVFAHEAKKVGKVSLLLRNGIILQATCTRKIWKGFMYTSTERTSFIRI